MTTKFPTTIVSSLWSTRGWVHSRKVMG